MGESPSENPSEKKLTLDIFKLLNRAETQSEAIDMILHEIKEHIGVSATAIRLEENGDYPYFFYNGFSDTHIEMESSLCDANMHQPACICGRVLTGNTDPSFPFFTEGGSFWCNNVDELLNSASANVLGETRNVCYVEGYQSVALVPLRDDEGIIGLLQLNDQNPDIFSLETIGFLEDLGESIGIALARLDEEDHRKRLEREQELLLHKYQLRIKELDCLYRISKLQENPDLTIGETINLIVNLIPGSTQFPEVAVARLSMEDQRYESEGFKLPLQRYSALIQNYGFVVGKLMIGYTEERPEEFKGPFLEEEIKLVNLVSETISRMLERKSSWDWQRSIDKYALVLNDEEIKHITKLVLEDMAIGEMDREEYNIVDVPEGSTQSMDSYMALSFNLELNRGLIIKLQNLLNVDEVN